MKFELDRNGDFWENAYSDAWLCDMGLRRELKPRRKGEFLEVRFYKRKPEEPHYVIEHGPGRYCRLPGGPVLPSVATRVITWKFLDGYRYVVPYWTKKEN